MKNIKTITNYNSRKIEMISELVDIIVLKHFDNDDSQIYNEEYSGYTEEAQDLFNELYDEFETIVDKIL